MPGSFLQNVQITMSHWDTTAYEITNFRESRAKSSEAMIQIAMIRLMLARLARKRQAEQQRKQQQQPCQALKADYALAAQFFTGSEKSGLLSRYGNEKPIPPLTMTGGIALSSST
jgi:hypothetical protein